MILCVFIPFFAASVEQQHALCSNDLLVLSDSTRRVRRIAAVSKQAAQAEITPGMLVRHAQTFVPELNVLPLNPPRYRQALDALLDTLQAFSDRIELTYKGWGSGDEKVSLSVQSAASSLNPAVLFLDIGTLKPQALFQFGKQLQDALKPHRLSVQIGIAANRFTAWAAAQAAQEDRIAYVAPGEEAWMLTCHSRFAAAAGREDAAPPVVDGYSHARRFRASAACGYPPAVWQAGTNRLSTRAGHRSDAGSAPMQRDRVLNRAFQFDGAVADRQMLDAALKRLSTELMNALAASGETARLVRLTLCFDNGGAAEYEMRLRRRTNTAVGLYNRLQSLLDRARLNAPIVETAVLLGDIVPVAARQLELFPTMQLVESRQAVLDDLVSCYGERFFIASVEDDQAVFEKVELA